MSLDSGIDLRLETHNVGGLHITRTTLALTAVTAQAEMTRNRCHCAADVFSAGGVSKPSTSLPSFARQTDTWHLITLVTPVASYVQAHGVRLRPSNCSHDTFAMKPGAVWAESLAVTRPDGYSSSACE